MDNSIVTLDEVKGFLRVDGDYEDTLITTLIQAAEEYLLNGTGQSFDKTNSLARLFCMVLISDWYENRETIGKVSEKTRYTVDSMMAQLQYCYGGDGT